MGLLRKSPGIALALALSVAIAARVYPRAVAAKGFHAAARGPTDPDPDFFPDKARVRYAKGFSIRYAKTYKVVDVFNPFSASPDTTRYVLVPRGKPAPAGFEKAVKVEVPVRTLACLSTTHVGLTDFLGINDRIIAISDTGRVLNRDVLARIRAGKIAEVGKEQGLNKELVLALAPDLLMTVGFPGKEIGSFQALTESGIAVVTNSEWMETSLLGRMEWVKLLAAFVNGEGQAERKFDSIEAKYAEAKRTASRAGRKPKVIGGICRQGVWTVPGGRSYVAGLLKDAGADYPFAEDTSTGSRNLGFETVYRAGLDAEFWLNAGWAKSLRDISDEDRRYTEFKCFKTKQVFNNTKRMGANGSNEYWESGLVNPHLILLDLVKILHPELSPRHELFYMRRLE
jgi:iron complex transport system substrate-binding protein